VIFGENVNTRLPGTCLSVHFQFPYNNNWILILFMDSSRTSIHFYACCLLKLFFFCIWNWYYASIQVRAMVILSVCY